MKTHTAKFRVCRFPRRLLPWAAAMLLTIGITVTLSADQEWRYVEGESYSAHDHGDLRSEGFTAWLGHPSGGKVAVILAPGGWLEYEVKDPGPGPYYVYVRALAWNERINTELFWDGQKAGQIHFAQPDTRLKWSNLVGRVTGPGSHKLRLEGEFYEPMTQSFDVKAGEVKEAVIGVTPKAAFKKKFDEHLGD